MRAVTAGQFLAAFLCSADLHPKAARDSLLLQIVLPARPCLTARVGAFEGLDTGVNPLVPLQMAAGRERPRADLTNVRFGLAFGRSRRPILPLHP